MYNTKELLNKPLVKGSYTSIITLAIPAIIENILQVFIGVVDTFFVSKVGTSAIAAVGVTNLLMNVYISFFLAIGIGTTVLISRKIGAKQTKEAGHVLTQSLMLSFIVGLVFGMVNLMFSKNLLSLIGADKDVLSVGLPYFLVVAVPSVVLSMTTVLGSALRGAGDTKTPMRAALIANVVNAILDPILIYGIFGLPGFGLLGAALATSFSRLVSLYLLLRHVQVKSQLLHLEAFKTWRLDKKVQASLIKLGIPAAIERLIMRSGQLIYGGLIMDIGTKAYAAHSIAGTIETFSYLPAMGFGVAASTLVGQQLGAKNPKAAKWYGLHTYYLATLFMLVVGGIFYVFAKPLAMIFTKDPQVIHQVVTVLRIIALFQPFLGMTMVTTSALQGAGDTRFPMLSSLIGIWGVRVLGVYILCNRLGMGLEGVWLAYAGDVTLRGSLLMVRYLRGKWQTLRIT